MKTIIATFATRAFAKQAAEKLRHAGFTAVSIDVDVTPEAVEAVSKPATADPGLEGLVADNIIGNFGQSMPMVAPLVIETLEANATARLTVKAEKSLDRAVAIIKDEGGMFQDERAEIARSTRDEMANAAQSPDRK